METKLKMSGIVEIKKFKGGKCVSRTIKKNNIMDNALDELIKSFYLTANSNMLFMHIAFGDDDTPNTDDMETLVNEYYRIQILSKRRTNVGVVQIRAVMTDLEPAHMGAACTIKEVGLFGGSGSYDYNPLAIGNHLNTGLLISRVVVDEAKDTFEQVQITWTITLERG